MRNTAIYSAMLSLDALGVKEAKALSKLMKVNIMWKPRTTFISQEVSVFVASLV